MLTASLVLYKTPHNQITKLLECIRESNCVSKLFVIDNFSTEENIKLFDGMKNLQQNYCCEIEYIPHENTGYGSSHNIALKKALEINSEYHLILNPDIEFSSDVLSKLITYMDYNKEVVYILPKVIYPDGELQYLCKLLPTPSDLIFRRFLPKNKFTDNKNKRYMLFDSGYNKIINPPCLSGCFMFLRMDTIKKYKLFFDEQYFMYMEDFDLMRRLHRVGKTIFYPEVTIIHNHAKESYKNKKMLKIHILSAIKYFNKYGWFFDQERSKWNKQILSEIEMIK